MALLILLLLLPLLLLLVVHHRRISTSVHGERSEVATAAVSWRWHSSRLSLLSAARLVSLLVRLLLLLVALFVVLALLAVQGRAHEGCEEEQWAE